MNEQRTTGPQTGLDKVFAALRGIGIRRRDDDKWIAGVCSGLAERLGVDPVIVRAALILLSLLGGAGLTIYLVAWALLPDDRNEIVAERALRGGDSGAIVLLVFAALALFGGSMFNDPWWAGQNDWGFPWGLALTGLLIWWLVKRADDRPDANQRMRNQQPGTPTAYGPSSPVTGPSPAAAWPASSWPAASAGRYGPVGPAAPGGPVKPRKLRRRSGGPLMGLVAIGLALVTYGALSWAGNAFSWTGDHEAIAIAGSLASIGLLLIVLGVAGWRSGFATFLAIILALSAWTATAIPSGIHFGVARIGDAVWTPTSLTAGSDANYQLGFGDGVLDLSGLPTGGSGKATVPPTVTVPPTIPAYVGFGDLEVIVPADLTVKIVSHVGLGKILLPDDTTRNHQDGTDVSSSVVIGDGPTEVVVDAGVGIGQITVVKE